MASRLLALAGVMSTAAAQFVTTAPMAEVPEWQVASEMILSVTAVDAGVVPLQYTVAPLTANLGLNQTDAVRNVILIQGNMQLADVTNYNTINDSNAIAYLSCDSSSQDENDITPTLMLNTLMSNRPKSIILYSMIGNACGLQGSNLPYSSIFTMVSREEAISAWNLTSMGNGQLRATIAGNVSSNIETQETNNATSGNNSAVAMSILYSITGLITLLFLVIIATGAIRAHRYPERYGPRSGYGGQRGQSRAKGIARAVLETLPIIKFTSPAPAKPDPAIELEQGPPADTLPDRPAQSHLSTIREEPETPRRNAGPQLTATGEEQQGIGPDAQGANGDNEASSSGDSDLSCSICTEDFTVGEDVRVLPCNHKFHPACVDPWLINVSGTCPLCRLDLRPASEKRDPSLSTSDQLLPPLSELEASEQFSQGSRRRSSRFLDLHRLRHASVEERLEGLRRFRTEEQNHGGGVDEDRTRRARLAERLRERFRIRTRAQSPSLSRSSPPS